MKKFDFNDLYLIKAFVYGFCYIISDSVKWSKGWLFLTLLMFVFYLRVNINPDNK